MIALAEARAVHFGKGGPEIKENLFLPFGQGIGGLVQVVAMVLGRVS